MSGKSIVLSRGDWNLLDDLLSRHGFGGYYDLVETLKQIGGDLGITMSGLDLYPEHEGGRSINLPQMIQFLQDWVTLLKRTEGLDDVINLCAVDVEVHRVGEGVHP